MNTPNLKRVNATVDLLPQRRIASLENAWVADHRSRGRDEVPVKVYLRPYRGERIEREVQGADSRRAAKGRTPILLSDADTLNRMQNVAGPRTAYRPAGNRLADQSGAQQ